MEDYNIGKHVFVNLVKGVKKLLEYQKSPLTQFETNIDASE